MSNIKKNKKSIKTKKTTSTEVDKIDKNIHSLHDSLLRLKKRNKILMLMIFVLLIILLLLLLQDYNRKPEIKDITYSEKYNEDKTKTVSLDIKNHSGNKIYCKFANKESSSDWILAEKDVCSYNIKTDEYTITLKYNGDLKVKYKEKFDIDGIINFSISDTRKYIPVGESFKVNASLDYVGEKYNKIEFKSSDPNIATVDENGVVTGVSDGRVKISVTGGGEKTEEFELISSSLIRSPSIDNYREVMPCNSFTKEQIELADEILATKIKDAGEGTRAAATEAARFITLELKYKVPYFFENGRLSVGYKVDGEGRYYHKGLYLGKDKESQITLNSTGPASWGCPLRDAESGLMGRNGLDCSGYVTWTLVQAGLDLGDIGAGITGSRDYTDVGEFQRVTYSLLTSGKVKPGDLIGWDGHIAIIAAMDDNNIYVTESLQNGVIIDEYNYSSPSSRFYSRYQHIIDMSGNYYNGDGNLKNMW
ncbi:MAG: Ig-like domain-containing protein [Bacilli bacterium]|nr:Ig-like domain-containing protein [Bacilli bacterium]